MVIEVGFKIGNTIRKKVWRGLHLSLIHILSAFFTGCHSGTHLDAPLHFLEDGSSAAQIPLEYCFGPCSVVTVSGWLTGSDMEALIPKCEKRILLKGNGDAFLTESAAQVLADYEIFLVGTDASSIAIPEDEAAPHLSLIHI